jgi:replicative DNA helicase
MGFIDRLDKLLGPHLFTEAFLLLLMSENFSAYGCDAWAKMVREYAERRMLIQQGTKLVQQGYGTQSRWVDKYEGMF